MTTTEEVKTTNSVALLDELAEEIKTDLRELTGEEDKVSVQLAAATEQAIIDDDELFHLVVVADCNSELNKKLSIFVRSPSQFYRWKEKLVDLQSQLVARINQKKGELTRVHQAAQSDWDDGGKERYLEFKASFHEWKALVKILLSRVDTRIDEVKRIERSKKIVLSQFRLSISEELERSRVLLAQAALLIGDDEWTSGYSEHLRDIEYAA